MSFIKSRYGIIVACDITDVSKLSSLVSATCGLDCVVGYKIGMLLALSHGLDPATDAIRKYTSKLIIYDHQKFGTDIPEVCSGAVLRQIKSVGIDALIIFPQAGIETLRATLAACHEQNICPIVGGEMTHPGYLKKEGGYIDDDAPRRMYIDAARNGASHFVVPGTKIDRIQAYHKLLVKEIPEPVFLFPGIGKGQGGDIVCAFKATLPHSAYAIVGRSIYQSSNPAGATEELWQAVRTAGLGS
jgi:orotidine-5'-phosphate decarboxylase